MVKPRYSIGFWKPIFAVSFQNTKGWINFTGWAEYWYNTTYQGAAKCTPSKVVYGRAPSSLTRFI